MTSVEVEHGLWIHDRLVGVLHQRGDVVRFTFLEAYVEDPRRDVLGLAFEDRLHDRWTSALRLPSWFSHLLPEGVLREWIAADRKVSPRREMELLAQVGRDLPGAVRVGPLVQDGSHALYGAQWPEPEEPAVGAADGPRWRFSLAGVQLKFSMVRESDRLTLPATGQGGDWIVKLPDPDFPGVPANELHVMRLAEACGMEVPTTRLVHRDEIEGLPGHAWRSDEEWAYAVRRFDRGPQGSLIHIEDFAQVRGFAAGSDEKYRGSFDSVAAIVYRVKDDLQVAEFARRLAFCIAVGNGDAHLKNWSLIYRDPRKPVLSPAYDMLCADVYAEHGEQEMALKLGRRKRWAQIGVGSFEVLGARIGAPAGLLGSVAAETVALVADNWGRASQGIAETHPDLALRADAVVAQRLASIRRAGAHG